MEHCGIAAGWEFTCHWIPPELWAETLLWSGRCLALDLLGLVGLLVWRWE